MMGKMTKLKFKCFETILSLNNCININFRDKMSLNKTDVYLGFANELEANELFSLKRQYLPLGKIGGKPSWLNPTNIPEISQLTCSVYIYIYFF